MDQSEIQIIQLLQSGDRKAIELLYDRYADGLFGILLNMLKDEATAKDVLHECFIKVWKNAGRYDPGRARLFTWLVQIARNTAIDHLRAAKTRKGYEIQTASSNVSDLHEKGIVPEHIDIPDHLASLEPKYRDVLQALYFKGMTQQETSEALDLPLGTVKTRLKIGLRELRKVFGLQILKIILSIILLP